MKKALLFFVLSTFAVNSGFSQLTAPFLYSNFTDTAFVNAMNQTHSANKTFNKNDVFNVDYNQYRFFITIKMDSIKESFK